MNDHTVVFLSGGNISFSITISGSINIITKDKILFFLLLCNIPVLKTFSLVGEHIIVSGSRVLRLLSQISL